MHFLQCLHCNNTSVAKLHSSYIVALYNMQQSLVICIVLCCSCSYALPFLTPKDEDQVPLGERAARSSDHHDYVETIFELRREIIDAQCNKTFNGQKVSPHFCESNKLHFIPLEKGMSVLYLFVHAYRKVADFYVAIPIHVYVNCLITA